MSLTFIEATTVRTFYGPQEEKGRAGEGTPGECGPGECAPGECPPEARRPEIQLAIN